MLNLLDDLAKAKDNVRWLLDHPEGLSDMKGLTYWAGRVEYLRSKIRKAL